MLAKTNIYSGGGNETLLSLTQLPQSADDSATDPEQSSREDIGRINQLIIACSFSKDALEELYNMFRKSIFALAYSITSDYQLAEDTVIETFVRLTQTADFNPKKGDGKGYIHRIARNIALELRRSYRSREMDILIQSYGEADQTVEDSIFINQLLKCLTDKQRQTVVMKVCSGLTFREIARVMKCPETTVKSRFNKAMAKLKEEAGVKGE
ncbi:MAG: sigma-70 family RNA polymerase sigma factor [Ruminococcus sp.]|nr:sigma-70 family RNA polymerase sigma factor [Ruminococcus sp.]